MTSLVLTSLAQNDLAFILDDLVLKAGLPVAMRYAADFDRLFARLETFPESGALRIKLGRDVRIGTVAPYVVIYRFPIGTDEVAIVRIVHGRRRISSRLLR